ncbi:protein kinase [Nocardia sp. NPDC052566]|uniref:serine/threonine-protein kinase n=1 Tax=Nocardia sp. NPDC052566 TaxID=3364330 RepID=UPI0037C843E6
MTEEIERLRAALPGYEIGDELGRGGCGVVLAGVHRRLRRPVAIKQIPPQFAYDETVRRRFVAEARVLAAIDHPHVVRVFDYLEHEDLCVLVMEYLPGGTVGERFATEGFDSAASVAIALACAAGLAAAHQHRVLHRDVKPANLMFATGGAIKLTDFGIAKIVGGDQTLVTRAGDIVGTPSYIAPEQARGQELSPATDVYALATMLYQLLSGVLPFPPADGPLATLFAHAFDEPIPLGEVAPSVPEPIAQVVMRGLATDPAQRYDSAESFGIALAQPAAHCWGGDWLTPVGIPVIGADTIIAAATGGLRPARPHGPVTPGPRTRPAPARHSPSAPPDPAAFAPRTPPGWTPESSPYPAGAPTAQWTPPPGQPPMPPRTSPPAAVPAAEWTPQPGGAPDAPADVAGRFDVPGQAGASATEWTPQPGPALDVPARPTGAARPPAGAPPADRPPPTGAPRPTEAPPSRSGPQEPGWAPPGPQRGWPPRPYEATPAPGGAGPRPPQPAPPFPMAQPPAARSARPSSAPRTRVLPRQAVQSSGVRLADIDRRDLVPIQEVVTLPSPRVPLVAAAALAVASVVLAYVGLGATPSGGDLRPGQVTIGGADLATADQVPIDLATPIPLRINGIDADSAALTMNVLGFPIGGGAVPAPGGAASIPPPVNRFILGGTVPGKVTLLRNGTEIATHQVEFRTAQPPTTTATAAGIVVLALFALAYLESNIRTLRRGRGGFANALGLGLSAALLATATLGACWILLNRPPTLPTLIASAALAATAGLAAALAARRRGTRNRYLRRRSRR